MRPSPCLLLPQGQGHGVVNNGVGGVPTTAVVDAVVSAASSVAPPPPRPATGPGSSHPLLPPRQCPRCGSGNTKFCYYNNYSRSQPRYLCRACRRHWTEGGTLRDVPVGGGRKNRRGGKARASSSSSATATGLAAMGGSADVAFPDISRQVLFQPVGAVGGGSGYSIDLSAWQQMAPPPQGTGDANGALGGTATDANCGALQYWSWWQHDDVAGLDGAC
jgi:hypothetical protein